MDTWTPTEMIQESDPQIVRCVNFDETEKLFACIGENKYMMVGSDVTITVDNIDMFLEDATVFEDEFENNDEYEPVKNTIPKDKFNLYVESCEYENALEELGVEKLDTCAICQEEITEGIVGITPCSHAFHLKCIKKWLTKKCVHPVCPCCNTDVRSLDD